MATISIQTKKLTDLENIHEVADEALFPVHDGNGVKTISAGDFLATMFYDGAGAHNSIYRGKYLGSAVTDEQYAAISAGTFRDLYIGDYWTIGGVDWRIAAFDYHYNGGDVALTKHHALIVPDTILYSAQMNETDTTTGGYADSAMRTANLTEAITTIKAAFGDHVVNHRQYLANAVNSSGQASGGSWYDCEVELMNEIMVYGCVIHGSSSAGANGGNAGNCNGRLPLFTLRHDLLYHRQDWWLRDVATAADFSYVTAGGRTNCYRASNAYGVRPVFLIA